MALLPNYVALNSASQNNPTAVNTSFTQLYNLLGTSGAAATWSDANAAVGAALNPAKVSGTAAVLTGGGTQAVTKVSSFSSLIPLGSPISGNVETVVCAASIALSSSVLYHIITGATGPLATITGGVEGQLAVLIFVGAPTITSSTANTVNSIHLKATQSVAAGSVVTAITSLALTPTTTLLPHVICLQFSQNWSSALTVAQWVEVPFPL